MKRIAIIGAGNSGCMTALVTYAACEERKLNCEILIYHDPKNNPIELVGQGTVLGPPKLISHVLGINWYNNTIDATFKTGILYEGWGKKRKKFFHPFTLQDIGIHFVPEKLSKAILNFKDFTVIEKKITNPEKEIDADIIFDCRGRNDRDKNKYDKLLSPINSVLIGKKNKRNINLTYTRTVATPNGWTFVIPNTDSVSYGYLYNNKITSKETATKDYLKRFNLSEVTHELVFDNYIAKNIFTGERTVLQGNKCGFLEPLEANSIDLYIKICTCALDIIFKNESKIRINNYIRSEMKKIETFILWHYQFGSQYDTEFWEYAKSLPFKPDKEFIRIVENKILNTKYGQWEGYAFKYWLDGVFS